MKFLKIVFNWLKGVSNDPLDQIYSEYQQDRDLEGHIECKDCQPIQGDVDHEQKIHNAS